MNKILILDFGSQYTKLIARRIRDLKVFSEIKAYNADFNPDDYGAIILSGGPASVLEKDSPKINIDKLLKSKKPVLGICYGLQLIVHSLGGQVVPSDNREYGRATLKVHSEDILFDNTSEGFTVWMSHGDSLLALPDGFKMLAKTNSIPFAAIKKDNIYGLQFHPEVYHTSFGTQIIKNFLFKIAKLKADWAMDDFINSKIKEIQNFVDGNVIVGVSGGVDSTVLAVLLEKSLGKSRVKPVFVNNGVLRYQEVKEVTSLFKTMNIGLHYEDVEKLFLSNLKGVDDPEKKRKIIGHTFIDVFKKSVDKFDAKFLAQGTLYPDVIESVSFKGPSVVIKSHHNVGGLPKELNLKLVEPFRELFKDEVREVGRKLGVPEEFLMRHPFPGPGLAVRILGNVTKQRLDILRQVDDIFIKELKNNNLYNKIWQAFAVFIPVKSVGVMGDSRTYENLVSLRAVTSIDGMTADWFYFQEGFLRHVSNRIINEVNGVNRVVYDISSKPPATIEWE